MAEEGAAAAEKSRYDVLEKFISSLLLLEWELL